MITFISCQDCHMDERPKPDHESHLDRAMQLALNGAGRVSPNPMVGCVVVSDGEVIGEGWHAVPGGPHAERVAIEAAEAAGHEVRGATVYVSLEPCGHQGRQPPCAELLIEKEVAEVVVGCDDNSEKTAGHGPSLLRDAGIGVRFAEGDQADRARELVQDFRKFSATGRPLVTLKMAASVDGRVAGPGGDPVHLTGAESDRLVHEWRAAADAVAIGAGTLRTDDPRLTAREVGEVVQPARVVYARAADLGDGAALFDDLPGAPVILITEPGDEPDEIARLRARGVEVIEVGGNDRAERFASSIEALGDHGIHSILLEGGPTLAGAALESGSVDRIEVFIAPVVLGEGPSKVDMSEAMGLAEVSVSRAGPDVRMSAVLKEW
jgi:diaminohydroxyphosphoribosylaminopyrimidine deaminase/5-amino-6-(5-phosphoribosylamino)uracil reductase